MIFNVEETSLLRAFDTSTRRTAILSMMNEMGMMEDMELVAQCMSMVKKLEGVTDEEFAAVDFTVYDDEDDYRTWRIRKMSKWDEEHVEPMHDHPAEKDQLVAAMEAAGYVLDTLESTEDNLRFYGAYGNVMTMGGWHECEEWLNGVVFDDPQVSDRVEIILHPERFPEVDPQRAALRAVEDAVEQNDNSFDGIINNMPQPDPAEVLRQSARDSEAASERRSVLEALKASQQEAAKAAEAEVRKRRPRIICDEEAPMRI